MFGYYKNEIQNKNINSLMPFIFSKIHDDILKMFLETNELNISNKERYIYGKHKNGYAFNFLILIKPVQLALNDGIVLLAIMKKEKNIRNIATVLCTTEGLIKDLTSSAINIIGLDIKTINMQQLNIQTLV